jgi:hypothetical protein
MDRKQLVVERVREVFGDRLDDVRHMVQQDRQELRGWEEPAHVRAAMRRSVQEGNETEFAEVTVAELELGRRAGEPDRGQQREGVGHLLEAGSAGLEKMARNASAELTFPERLGLECVLLLYGRPAVLLREGRLAGVPPFWNILEDQREDVEMAQRGVGRIELLGHPEFDWAGTAFLVGENTLLTTRRTAELFIDNQGGSWQFRPGITSWMNYRSEFQGVPSAGYRVRGIVGVHDVYDLAVLEVESPQANDGAPLSLAALPPPQLDGRPVYLVGYPARDARRNEPELITRIFRDVYNVKRVQPGLLRGGFQFRDVQFLRHDCALLGQSSGSCIVDLETHQVLGLHLAGRYLETSTAIPLWALRDDPLFRRAGINFNEATSGALEATAQQIERLARTRYWSELRNNIATLYQRAFGHFVNDNVQRGSTNHA